MLHIYIIYIYLYQYHVPMIFERHFTRITLGEYGNSNSQLVISVPASTIHQLSLLQILWYLFLGHIPKRLDSTNHFCSECV